MLGFINKDLLAQEHTHFLTDHPGLLSSCSSRRVEQLSILPKTETLVNPKIFAI